MRSAAANPGDPGINGYLCNRGTPRNLGRGERIRTSDILLPKQARYRAALHPAEANYAISAEPLRTPQPRSWR